MPRQGTDARSLGNYPFAAIFPRQSGDKASRVQNKRHFRSYVNERRQQGIEHSERSQTDADGINGQGTGKVRHYDAMTLPGDLDGFDEVQEIIPKKQNVRALASHIGSGAHRDSYICLRQRRRVINTVSYHGQYSTGPHQLLDTIELLMRQQLGLNRIDTQLHSYRVCNRHGIACQ